MKAVVYRRYGPPEVLRVEEVPKPTLGEKDLLIKVQAVEVTKSDCELRSFRFPVGWYAPMLRLYWGLFRPRPRHRILGSYFAGTIEAVGGQVSRFKAGDDVMGCAGFHFGAYAEYLRLPEDSALVSKPANLGFPAAAASLLGGLNAQHFLTQARVQPGEQVLINGAGGSIGLMGVQIAKAMGAEVTAVDAGHKEALVRKAGADDFIDYQNEDFGTRLAQFDVVFDVVARSSYSKCLSVLKAGGRYQSANPSFGKLVRAPWTTRFSDKSASCALAPESVEALQVLVKWLTEKGVTPIVELSCGPEEAVAAHHAVASEQRLGARVLSFENSTDTSL